VKYFLDSNIIIYFIKGTFRKIGEKLEEHEKDIVIPSVVLAELEYGARNSNDYEKTISVYKPFLDLYPTAVFDKKSSVEYGKLRKKSATLVEELDDFYYMLVAEYVSAHSYETFLKLSYKDFAKVRDEVRDFLQED